MQPFQQFQQQPPMQPFQQFQRGGLQGQFQRGGLQGRGRGGYHHINNQQARARRADIMSILASTASVHGGVRGGRRNNNGNNRRY